MAVMLAVEVVVLVMLTRINNNNDDDDCISRASFHVKHAQLR